ncbi:uncharacterized protein EI90DRAFT_3063242 [Cantharellus anzutake]|uniref:uncharacterized protein n=1 Tax=Cantharellus anzutake TaxID=1750568 RepID=UPI001906C869|nr:uncharacterized protein EI90DRAFT_3063242 [Cantharellus anzutake]KAF8329123.1 hypothetical protein EI90DRAFT_3063242 [Cantharellus anzutake]
MAEDHQALMNGDEETSRESPSRLVVRSHYTLTRGEVTRSFANRLLHSHAYIFFYLCMTALSITTVVLSLVRGCPGTAFFVLEFIINTAMIIEVITRVLALSKLFWTSVFNWLDIAMTLFCFVTLIVILSTPCASKEEEVFDTLLLAARNIVQFWRLAAIMKKSGTSIFARPKPIDLSRSRAMDIDLDDDELESPSNAGYVALPPQEIIFDSRQERQELLKPSSAPVPAPPEGEEDTWANLG